MNVVETFDAENVFDYVIVGGGTAGCILADRLSENGGARVALLEAGGEGRSVWINIPAGFAKLLTGSKYNWRFQTEPEPNVHGRTLVVPRGKGLGGSTLINGMIYVRGQPQDYDGWAQRGCRGWSYDDVAPYFKKLENYDLGGPDRGRNGPMRLMQVKDRHELAEAFIEAAIQAGHERNQDYNSLRQDGFGYYQVTQSAGRRWSVVDGYLNRARARKNLKIFTGALVERIELAGKRAIGVQYSQSNKQYRVRARNEVILSAGAVQSPQILELSGIGNPQLLQSLGIEVVAPRTDVGENYQDHFCTRMNWRISKPITINELSRGWKLALQVAKYGVTRRGLLTIGTGMAHGFVRTHSGLHGPDVQFFFMHASYANAADRSLDRLPGMTLGVTQLRPNSRGSIHTASADPSTPPKIRPNFLADAVDQQTIVDGMKIARSIVHQKALAPYLSHEMSPGSDVGTDEQWLDFARRNGQTIYHPCGTCRMGGDDAAVVDDRLRVRGIERLRVIDASIMPTLVSANTQAAVMMIAEKGADIVLGESKRLGSPAL